jgi:hypothetical protein
MKGRDVRTINSNHLVNITADARTKDAFVSGRPSPQPTSSRPTSCQKPIDQQTKNKGPVCKCPAPIDLDGAESKGCFTTTGILRREG